MSSTDTQGKLSELIDVIIEEGTALFVCAVGVPPKEVVDALHAANIPISKQSLSPVDCLYLCWRSEHDRTRQARQEMH